MIFAVNLFNTPIIASDYIELEGGMKIVEVSIDDKSVANAVIEEEGKIATIYSGNKIGKTKVRITSEDGINYLFNIESKHNKFSISKDKDDSE